MRAHPLPRPQKEVQVADEKDSARSDLVCNRYAGLVLQGSKAVPGGVQKGKSVDKVTGKGESKDR